MELQLPFDDNASIATNNDMTQLSRSDQCHQQRGKMMPSLLLLFLWIGLHNNHLVHALAVPSDGRLSETTIPPLLNVPTYSMATLNDNNLDPSTTNMNIVTYATPVSVRPDRVWCIGLFKGTKSEENFRQTRKCILQLLTTRHTSIIPILGGTTGRDDSSITKAEVCKNNGLQWIGSGKSDNNDDSDNEIFSSIKVLPHCAYYIHLTAVGNFVDAGSHVIAPCCKVEAMYVGNSSSDNDTNEQHQQVEEIEPHLMTAYLRELGIITELGRVTEGLV